MSILTELPEPFYLDHRPDLAAAIPAFDMATARAAAWFTQLAYETADPAKVARILDAWGWQLHEIHAGRLGGALPLVSSRGFLATSSDAAVLAFSGTDPLNIADWIRDFSITRTPDGIHAGFEAGIAAIWNSIAPHFAPDGPAAGKALCFTGHSLGGALATIAALRLVAAGHVDPARILGVYTFGMPRAGDAAFAAAYRAIGGGALAARTYRLIHGADIVPAIPPFAAPFAFRHFGAALACDRGGQFDPTALAPDAEEPTPQAAFLDLLRDLLPRRDLPKFPGHPVAAAVVDSFPPPIRDHVMDRYLQALAILPPGA